VCQDGPVPRADPPPRAARDLAALVRAEQARILFRQIPTAFAVHASLGALVVGMVWGQVSPRAVLGWYAAVVLTMALRLALWLAERSGRIASPPEAWLRRYLAAAIAAGLAWGSGALLILPESVTALRLGVTATVVCLAAGISAITLASAPAVLAFTVAGVSPYAVHFALHGDPFSSLVAATMVVFIAGNSFLARKNARLFAELIALRLDVAAQRDAAEQANQAKSRFLAAASHDLRQPLHAMTLLAEALGGRLRDEEDRHVLARLQDSLGAMGKLFNALLDISRLDAGIVEPQVRDFRLAGVLDRLDAEAAGQAAAQGLAWRYQPTGLSVRSDPVLLESLLRNLVGNALRYTPRGQVALRCREEQGRARIVVEDTGIGIPADRQAEIFREFHQLENPERDADKGLGLGLAIVDRLARLLGHRIELRSAPGQGSCFAVVLPLAARPVAEEAGPAAREPDPGEELAGMRVLVIDDQPTVRESMEVLLRHWGCEPLLAGSEEEAVAVARAGGPPELVIADYRLRSGRTGGQAVERLRQELGRSLAALIITGDTAPERLREASAGDVMLMSKPVTPGRLRAFLRSVRRKQGS
jgi:signal transduction histidine kinase